MDSVLWLNSALLALLLRRAVNHDPLTAPTGEAKLVEAEQHQAQQERERSLE